MKTFAESMPKLGSIVNYFYKDEGGLTRSSGIREFIGYGKIKGLMALKGTIMAFFKVPGEPETEFTFVQNLSWEYAQKDELNG